MFLFRFRSTKRKSMYWYKLKSMDIMLKIYRKGWETDVKKLKQLRKKYEENRVFINWVNKRIKNISFKN